MKIQSAKRKWSLKNMYIMGNEPNKDWPRLIIIWFAVLLGVFVWSYFFHFSVQDQFKTDFNSISQTTSFKDKESEIKDVTDRYKIKEENFNKRD
jgi:hypothetical protein